MMWMMFKALSCIIDDVIEPKREIWQKRFFWISQTAFYAGKKTQAKNLLQAYYLLSIGTFLFEIPLIYEIAEQSFLLERNRMDSEIRAAAAEY